MNTNKNIILLGISLLISFIIFKKYRAEENNYKEYYILQVGAYNNYDNVIKNTKTLENYMVYEENNMYKIFIGITKDNSVYKKLEKNYAKELNTFKKTMKINDKELEKKIENFDSVIKNTNDKSSLNIIIKEELKIFENFLNKKRKIWYHINS